MGDEIFAEARELRSRRKKAKAGFINAIRRPDLWDIDYVSRDELAALAEAIESCSADDIANCIMHLTHEISDVSNSRYDEGYSDGLDDCED